MRSHIHTIIILRRGTRSGASVRYLSVAVDEDGHSWVDTPLDVIDTPTGWSRPYGRDCTPEWIRGSEIHDL